MPDPAQVGAALDYLAGLGLEAPADLEKLLKVFPEALGLRVEVMADNVQVGAAPRWWVLPPGGRHMCNAVGRNRPGAWMPGTRLVPGERTLVAEGRGWVQ